jgi:NADH-dependent peroxiredoxin subunit F
MYDLIIIGGGPAGVAGGVYAGRKRLKTLLITEGFGGQSIVSDDIQNWIGDVSVSGYDLAKRMETQVKAQETIEVVEPDTVTKVEKITNGFQVTTKNAKVFDTKTLLITSGSRRRKLGVPGEEEFNGKGVAYCSTCDAPLFQGKAVVVVGGGNAGLEAVVDLLQYASKVYLMVRGEALRGDQVTQEKINQSDKVEVMFNSETAKIIGDKFVTGIYYRKAGEPEEKHLVAQGIFIEIGSVPNNEFLGDLVEKNKLGEIVVDHMTQKTSQAGIWAAGDVTDVLYKQNNASMGDAVKAALNIYDYLK